MNIVHVIRDLFPVTGGPVAAIKGLANAQSALGHTVSIATTYFDTDYTIKGNFEVHAYPCQYNRWCLSSGLAKALPGLISEADIVHLHAVWEFPVWAAARVAKKLGKPYILRPCGMLNRWSLSQSALKKKLYAQLFLQSIIANASAIHFTSENEKIHTLIDSNADRSFVIPNGLSSSALQDLPAPKAFIKRFPKLEGKRLILFLGRLHTKKQPDVLIRAFQKVHGNHPDIHLVVAGPGNNAYVAELKQLAKDLNVDEKVTFTGMLLGDAVSEAYKAAELFVLPSLHENFGIAVAESMAAGCPVVISDKVDLASDILNANAGLVCAPEIEPTARAINKLLEDSNLRNRMSANGRKLVLDKFTWDKIANDLFAVQQDILSGRHVSSSWR